MIIDETDDPRLTRLGRLPVLEPDPVHVDRVRARCCGALARRHNRAERASQRRSFVARVIEPALTGALCVSYLVAMIYDIVQLHVGR